MKRTIPFLLILAMMLLALAGCGGKDPVADEPDIEPDEGEPLELAYEALRTAVGEFYDISSGVITTKINRVTDFYNDNATTPVASDEMDSTYTFDFQASSNGYEYICIEEIAVGVIPNGSKQENGIRTAFTHVPMEDGTHKWLEGPALKDHKELPPAAGLFGVFGYKEDIESIAEQESGDGITYIVKYVDGYDAGFTEESQSHYSVSDCKARYHINKAGSLTAVKWTYTESYTADQQNIQKHSTLDMTLSHTGRPVDMDFFEKDGTYVPVAYTDVTDTWRKYYINIPETFILDVNVPKLKDSLPNANKINDAIAVDMSFELTASEDNIKSETSWGGYPWHTTDYAVYKLGDVYEICIFNTEASAYGSGVSMWMYRYLYDSVAGDVISEEDFLAGLSYTKEMIVDEFVADFLGGSGGDFGEYTYEDVRQYYYFDGEGKLQFYANLFG